MTVEKESQVLRIGVLGCGPIAQVAHFDSCRKAIDPSQSRRADNIRRFEVLAIEASSLGTSVPTPCTGTRDADDMWRHHPHNRLPTTWREMTVVKKRIVKIAETFGMVVAIEPEPSNVVNSAAAARKLLNEIGSAHLKIVFDGANLLDSDDSIRMCDVLAEGVELLGPDIMIAHAKDVRWKDEPQSVPAGSGMKDYSFYLERLTHAGFSGPLILHGLDESDAPRCIQFLSERLVSTAPARWTQLQSTLAK